MVQIYVEIAKNVSFFISCITFCSIFIESFNEISLIQRSVNYDRTLVNNNNNISSEIEVAEKLNPFFE